MFKPIIDIENNGILKLIIILNLKINYILKGTNEVIKIEWFLKTK